MSHRIEKYDLVRLEPGQYVPPKDEFGERMYHSSEFELVAFLCPCGCGNEISIPVGTKQGDWSMRSEVDGSLTLDPSLLQRGGCKSHFFIESCCVRWV